ncbi:MAG: DUF2065 domain-containing protein [Methylophilaceae bacterium]
MISPTLLAALGLMLVFEGLLPLVAPKAWRETFRRMIDLKDGQLRFIGLISISSGLLILILNH